jgi:hypothetical protein
MPSLVGCASGLFAVDAPGLAIWAIAAIAKPLSVQRDARRI